MKHYVCGFAFNGDGSKVILILKNRPKWQEGKLNGVGGKIEEWVDRVVSKEKISKGHRETPDEAMAREFKEEAGVETRPAQRYKFCEYWNQEKEGMVHFFKTHLMDRQFNLAATQTDEHIIITNVKALQTSPCIPNLLFLIPMALHKQLITSTIFES